MNKTLATILCATTFLMTTGCGSIITAMSPDPMSEEVAQKTFERNQMYLTDHSFASNICRYTVTSDGDISCYKDVEIPRAEYEKTFGKNKGPAGSDFATSLALYSLPAIANSSAFFSSFDNWGPGALILIGDTLKGEGLKEKERFVAFVPMSKAKTKEEAVDYVYQSFYKAFRSTYKKYGFKETWADKDFAWTKIGNARDYSKAILITDNNGCDRYKNDKGQQRSRCGYMISHHNWYLDGYQTVIPTWLPDAGQKAWVVTGNARFVIQDGYTGAIEKRDIAIDVAKGLPTNFYLLIPETFEGSPLKGFKKLPPFVVSNKHIYFYAVPEN